MRSRVCEAKRIVVKLGSNLFFNEGGAIALGRIYSFIEDIAAARLAGRQVIVVSSGAVALGADALKMKSANASLAQKQALAAIGQSRLMNLYEQARGGSPHPAVRRRWPFHGQSTRESEGRIHSRSAGDHGTHRSARRPQIRARPGRHGDKAPGRAHCHELRRGGDYREWAEDR